MTDMTISHPNYKGHAIELVACRDVLIDNDTITPVGTPGSSLETMVQIDIATDATYPRAKGTQFSNGATCKNVTVQNCSIKGERAIATGYDYAGQGYVNNSHTGIRIINNDLTSYNAEGIFLANAKTASVKGNTVVSRCKKYSSEKSIGIHYLLCGKVSKASFTCSGNTVKGGQHAVRAYSVKAPKVKIKSVTIKNNKLYCKKGKKNAIRVEKKAVSKLKTAGNKTKKW